MLKSLLEQSGDIPVRKKGLIAVQVCRALRCESQRRRLQFDLKQLTSTGHLKLYIHNQEDHLQKDALLFRVRI